MESKVFYESPTGTNHPAENFGEVLCFLWPLCCCERTGDQPDLQVYLPRHRDGSTHPSNPDCEESGESSSSGSSEPEPPGHQLFCLEYEADSGDITSVIVYQDDDPGRVSEEVSAHTPLEPLMREALKLRIQEEIAKRQSRH
ncbi:hypothetical protein Celaphus_00005514 [Cervus elaphus hippelaphus]|uniref:Uncharacterized protein n=1 Tax=Cervus elaphus hippelaphus TaxID=46360 RepID=A0A212CWR1_CEREH|nr:hypothetical protein Celaphus_00005514 [Cervus elaphus hippelaphus]